ncbi:MAG: hypothetical protein ACREQY_00320, partial [Candidatus Binatia bacterium]
RLIRAGVAILDDDVRNARAELGRAREAFESAGMSVQAAVARWGQAVVAGIRDDPEAAERLRDSGIDDPLAWARANAPGLPWPAQIATP